MATSSECPQLLEIDVGEHVHDVTFTANGELLVSGSGKGVQVWRVKGGQRVATMPVKSGAKCVAATRKYAAAGTDKGDLFVWDATTYEQVFSKQVGSNIVHTDFSPDATQLVCADHLFHTATIWDVEARQRVQTLDHKFIIATRYSPRGDQIATASRESIRVWDSSNGRLLVDVNVGVNGRHGLLWRNNHLFVITDDGKIKEIDASAGSTISERSLPDADEDSCIALLQHGKFIAYSVEKTIAFLDPSANTQPRPIQHTADVRSMSFSLDGQLLAIAARHKICVKVISSVVSPFVSLSGKSRSTIIKGSSPALFRFLSDPELVIDTDTLNAWKHGQLADAEASLSVAIQTPESYSHHVLASRALVRARLGQWDAALADAKDSIEIQRSLHAYVAKSVALVGKGEKDKGIRVCDIAFQHFHSKHVTLLLLIKAVVLCMAGDHVDAISRMDDLITDSVHAWVDPGLYVVQAYMHLLHGNKHMENRDYGYAIRSFEEARVKLGNHTRQPPLVVALVSGWNFDDLVIAIKQRLCEALLAADRTKEAGECLVRMLDEETDVAGPTETWIFDFRRRCHFKLMDLGDSAINAKLYDDAISHYTVALSLSPAAPQGLLVKRSNAWLCKGVRDIALNDAKEWVGLMLTSGSWEDTLAASVGFMLERFAIARAVCEYLEMSGRVIDAVACLHQISSESAWGKVKEGANWTSNFKSRCRSKLVDFGDSSTNAKQYDEAISQYTIALSLDPATPTDLLAKRSKAYAEKGEWEDALNDADKVIKLDPSSPSGHERKYVALLGLRRHRDATNAFETMLTKMSKSSDPEIREKSRNYVRPERTKEAIRTSIQSAIRDSPLVLINALSGRLCNKSEQAAAFESIPAFTTLVASMTTQINHALIEQAVGEFYRYATFSHTWEGSEPLYQAVIKTVVYDLAAYPTHDKLKMFCKIVRDAGFNWAWSDTCCINKADPFTLQESLVSMFKWYEGSALTVIFLCDVDRLAEIGALMNSLWNSRGWTLQEYHASKVVRIYTKDWTPYLGLTIYNHKESPEIISEMEKATGISAESLMALRPGLKDIREKLRLASTRKTTRVEDTAYSLLGIFSMTLPATYGEGDKSLGRLLSQLLSSSGDTSILAWTGKHSSFNSCLPTNISVFSQPITSYIPPAIPHAEMATIIAALHASSLEPSLVTTLYDQLNALPLPLFVVQRLKLPCLAVRIEAISPFRNGVFYAQAGVLGTVEIRTRKNIALADSLYLVHPWIDFLLDRRATGNIVDIPQQEDEPLGPDGSPSLDSFTDLPSISDADSLHVPSLSSPTELFTDMQIEFLARLRQPFGALLLAPTRRNVAEFRRIATESVITVQVQEITSATLGMLIQGVRVLDVL